VQFKILFSESTEKLYFKGPFDNCFKSLSHIDQKLFKTKGTVVVLGLTKFYKKEYINI
jgi:hypothetical protein